MKLINLWTPFPPERTGAVGEPRNPMKWLNRRIQVDRVNCVIANGHNPIASNDQLPWSRITWREFLDDPAYAKRKICLVLSQLPPGSQREGSAGKGYNHNTRKFMNLTEYKVAVMAVWQSLGKAGRQRVRFIQVENEIDYSPDIVSGGLWSEWVIQNIEYIKWLHSKFMRQWIVSGGQSLPPAGTRMDHGRPTYDLPNGRGSFNGVCARRGFGTPSKLPRFIYDWHLNHGTIPYAQKELDAWMKDFPWCVVGCFENINTPATPFHKWVRFAIQNKLFCISTFAADFRWHKWGVNTQKVKDIAVLGKPTSPGKWEWNRKYARAVTKGAKIAGTFG